MLPFTPAYAQRPESQLPSDDVVRVRTELVQTDVTVLDHHGRLVDGLGREQFELRVDDKARSISFFEPVTLQTFDDAKGTTAPATNPRTTRTETNTQPARAPHDRGRVVFFFIDDLHLSSDNLIRTRKAILQFIDSSIGQNDQVAIVSTSGQIGFLQQLTDNRAVLREAAQRLNYRRSLETYAGKVPISEYDAAQVSEHFNRELFAYLVAATASEFQTDALTAANMVINRVHQIGAQSRTTTINTLSALMGLMRSSAQLPGRKIVFFVTDGFIADPRVSNISEMLREVTKAAAQVGAVVYPMDARGVFSDTTTDASRNGYPDYTGSVSRNLLGETEATQEPLQILATETGGRAFINSNSFQDNFARALDESSGYYLLAWRPEGTVELSGKARVTVGIKGRPDLKVRVRRGFLEPPTRSASKDAPTGGPAARSTGPDDELRATLGSLYPLRSLPVALSVGYMNSAKGPVLLASMQIDGAALRADPAAEVRKTEVDVLGVAIDDRGPLSSFKQRLAIEPDSMSSDARPVIWNQQLLLVPGLYQVRVAVRERSSGRTGSAMQWIEVPDLSTGRLSMSSLFLGNRKPSEAGEKFATAPRPVMVDVEHRFARTSVLRFQTYIYNATSDASDPDVSIEARVMRFSTPIVVLPPARLPTDTTTDRSSLPYWAEMSLAKLPPGNYVLEVAATNRKTKAVALQQANFIVE
jgi:VWFA-related protein